MALWTGLDHAATVAQLGGAVASGLISPIIQAAVTSRQNKKECKQLAHRVLMIAELLSHLQDSEVMRLLRAGLGDTLREAHELVTSCQGRSAMYQFVKAGRQADRFRDVHRRIDSYMLAFPFVSHIDITRRLDRIYNILLPNDTSVPPAGSQSQLPYPGHYYQYASQPAPVVYQHHAYASQPAPVVYQHHAYASQPAPVVYQHHACCEAYASQPAPVVYQHHAYASQPAPVVIVYNC